MNREERIEKALAQPILKHSGEYEDNGQIYISSSALLYLSIEENKEHNERVNARVLEHFRSVIAGGNEPMFTAGPWWHYESLSLACAVARHTPSVWEKFTAVEKDKIDLIMRCFAICSAFVSNDCNFYMTGASLSGNYSKTWNPNHRMAMVFPAIAAYLFYLPDGDARKKVDDILVNFDHDEYIKKFDEYGFTRVKYCWTTEGTTLEDGTKTAGAKELMMNGGHAYLSVELRHDFPRGMDAKEGKGVRQPFFYHGFDLDSFKDIANDLYKHNYSGGKVISDTSSRPGGLDENGEPLSYILDHTKSPVEGQIGMMKELVSGDAHGVRSSTSYCMHDFVLVTESMAAMGAIGRYNIKDYPELLSQIKVGNADIIYKGEHGYRSYSNGKSYDTYAEDINYLILKDYWLEIASNL